MTQTPPYQVTDPATGEVTETFPFATDAEVAEALVQGPQLSVVQGAGGLLAVPGDERHGRPAIEQVNGGGHLVVAHGELGGDPLDDACRGLGGWLRGHGIETSGPR